MSLNEDSLFRTAEHSARAATDYFEPLKALSDADLYAVLAVRLQNESIERAPDDMRTGHSKQFVVSYRDPVNLDELPRDRNTKELGQRIFARWSKVLYGLACRADKQDSDLRQRLLDAVTGTSGGGVVIVAAVLTGYFGVSQPVAAIIAALTVRFFVAPAADEVCQKWAAVLGDVEDRVASKS
jgi:hypothetical protein